MSAQDVGKIAVQALSRFAEEKLDPLTLLGFTAAISKLVSLGVEAAITEANTARVSGDVLIVKDERGT